MGILHFNVLGAPGDEVLHITRITRPNGMNFRGGAARRNRDNIRLRSAYQIPGSSDNLTRNDDEDGSIGTEGESVSLSFIAFTSIPGVGSEGVFCESATRTLLQRF